MNARHHAAPLALQAQALPARGSRLARALLRAAGWQVRFRGLPGPQGVIAVAPHTSNWDFVVLVLAKWAIGLQVSFWGKDTLFRIPLFGRWLRWLGGVPVARHAPQGAVGQMAELMREARDAGRFMWLGLSPEGTRSRTEGWRSGFYRVALLAGVPVGVAALDFGRREVRFEHFWQLCGEPEADLAVMAAALEGARGRRAALAAPVRWL